MPYGRPDHEWAELLETGRGFLIERARLRRTTSYTEMNAALRNRTTSAGFDFALDVDRAAMGELLGQISDAAFAETGRTAHQRLGPIPRHERCRLGFLRARQIQEPARTQPR